MGGPLIIKKRRGEDNSKVVSVRIPDDIIQALEQISSECNVSRNDLIVQFLRYGLENVQLDLE